MKKSLFLLLVFLAAVSCNPFQKKSIESPEWLNGEWSGTIEGWLS